MGKKEGRAADLKAMGREIMMNVPRITVTGHSELYIENHKGIELYTRELIRVSTPEGSVSIEGKSLNIDAVRVSDVFISGAIERIEFEF